MNRQRILKEILLILEIEDFLPDDTAESILITLTSRRRTIEFSRVPDRAETNTNSLLFSF